jgi:hypothetical protein
MNKQSFRLFDITRKGTSVSFGTLLYATFTFLVSAFVSILVSPLIVLAFILELPEAIRAGINKTVIFWGSLTGEAREKQSNHIDSIIDMNYEREEFNRTQFEAEWNPTGQKLDPLERGIIDAIAKVTNGERATISINGSKPVQLRSRQASHN